MHIKRFMVLVFCMLASLACQQVNAQALAMPSLAASSAPEGTATLTPAIPAAAAPSTTATAVLAVPAVAASSPAPLTQPGLVDASTINGADTAWMMTSTALVLFMTLPGIALFYGGMVRRKSVLNVMACVVVICAVVSILWFAVGYSVAFTPGSGALEHFIGGTDRLWFAGLDYVKDSGKVAVSHIAPNIPESVYAMFQLTFAIITAALVVGAFVERMRFSAVLIFMSLWTLMVYAPIAHWVWEPNGWLARLGVLDFAGGSVVHVNAGVAGLVCAYVLGPRKGYGSEAFSPFNLGLTMAGAGMLWVGWFGFNAGSALASDGRAGLVAITPGAGFVSPRSALLIGLIAGIACYWGATGLKRILNADDSLDVFGVHGVGGIVGSLLTGVFASKAISGVEGSVLLQLIGVGSVMLYSLLMTALALWVTSRLVSLRVNETSERDGLDISQHAERMGS